MVDILIKTISERSVRSNDTIRWKRAAVCFRCLNGSRYHNSSARKRADTIQSVYLLKYNGNDRHIFPIIYVHYLVVYHVGIYSHLGTVLGDSGPREFSSVRGLDLLFFFFKKKRGEKHIPVAKLENNSRYESQLA